MSRDDHASIWLTVQHKRSPNDPEEWPETWWLLEAPACSGLNYQACPRTVHVLAMQ